MRIPRLHDEFDRQRHDCENTGSGFLDDDDEEEETDDDKTDLTKEDNDH